MKAKTRLKCQLVLILLAHMCSSLSSQSVNNAYLNARIQCEYKDQDGDSLILNCTLFTGVPTLNGLALNQASKSADSSGISINSLNQVGILSESFQKFNLSQETDLV